MIKKILVLSALAIFSIPVLAAPTADTLSEELVNLLSNNENELVTEKLDQLNQTIWKAVGEFETFLDERAEFPERFEINLGECTALAYARGNAEVLKGLYPNYYSKVDKKTLNQITSDMDVYMRKCQP